MRSIDGGICAVRGVHAAGLKDDYMGLALIEGAGPCAGVFTRNKVVAAPVVFTRDNLENHKYVAGTIINSGNANAFTGEQGMADAREMARLAADKLGVQESHIAVASTGVIGRFLDVGWIKDHLDEVYGTLSADPQGCRNATKAIMTTDLIEKEVAVELECGVRIGGITKGSGMIEPNMGTMLAFIYTDAILSADTLKACLVKANDSSFNMMVVDGDTSTNDMALLTATGASSIAPDVANFQRGLDYVLVELAKKIARDGEGATKLIEVQVNGASDLADARKAAKTIVRSPLVKSAIYGHDPNWGRVVAAAGYSGASLDQDTISLKFSDGENAVTLVDHGQVADTSANKQLKSIMESDTVIISVDLSLGEAFAVAWGCDLTYDYVRINAEYTT
ncbi:bifunctional ornithine acetyltransferase/N-acetylglutamate synthase [Methanohalophilus profundi]|uniref:bifunctional ornithine acetyltransferase/N-acetylglutamate synthase n=1 Tax=Methanohalophilus profundi TaxID=2138083 RepID=UPI00101DC30A|nr:bifunctional ornithine acetyltransferase/N-acetylglutamate synthase [Methanohalophilus profundi]